MKKTIIIGLIGMMPLALMSQFAGQAASYNNSQGDGGVSDALYNYAVGSISDRKAKSAGIDLDNIQGSPYLNNSFLSTSLFYGDEKVQDIYYRYNAYNDEIEMKGSILQDEPILGLDRDKNIKIIVEDNPLSFKTFVDKNGLTQNGYLMQLNDSKYKVYKRINVKYTEGQRALNSLTKATPPRFSLFDEYYLEIEGNNRIDEVQLRNRKFIGLLPKELQAKAKAKFKTDGFKINSEEDLLKAIELVENMEN